MSRKHYLIASLFSVILLTVVVIPLSGQQDGSYDPWMDLNDDGIIDAYDLQALALIYGTSGTPLNKTQLLLDLQSRVQALETRTPKKGYVSFPPSAFRPENDTQSYENGYMWLYGNGVFLAYVHLPNGTKVMNMTAHLKDNTASDYMFVHLNRKEFGAFVPSVYFAEVSTFPPEESPGEVILYDDTISPTSQQIDNENYLYTLSVYLSTKSYDLQFYGVIIEYEYPA